MKKLLYPLILFTFTTISFISGIFVNYFGDAYAEKLTTTYDYNNRYSRSSLTPVLTNNDITFFGDHEREHVQQYNKMGILFMPSYFLNGGISHLNHYEQQADKAGNASYLLNQ